LLFGCVELNWDETWGCLDGVCYKGSGNIFSSFSSSSQCKSSSREVVGRGDEGRRTQKWRRDEARVDLPNPTKLITLSTWSVWWILVHSENVAALWWCESRLVVWDLTAYRPLCGLVSIKKRPLNLKHLNINWPNTELFVLKISVSRLSTKCRSLTSHNLRASTACYTYSFTLQTKQTNSVALVRKRTIPTERPPFVGELQIHVARNFVSYYRE
jgi:hypothetical protein